MRLVNQEELAHRAGVTQSVVSRYESGRQQPSLVALERLLGASGLELAWEVRHAPGGPGGQRFTGPVGRILAAHLDEILDSLEGAGLEDLHLNGPVADGTERWPVRVVISGVVPDGVTQVRLMTLAGTITFDVPADVVVTTHEDALLYEPDGPRVPLRPE